jgi:hypothetical protein
MLYSALAMRGVEVVAQEGTHLGKLIDAYGNTYTAAVERLIVDAAAAGGPSRLIPTENLHEYDTVRRRLVLDISAADLAAMPPAPEGIPVMIPRPGDESGAQLHVVSKVVNFMVEAVDGTVGQAADFLVDSDGWVIRYLVVDTRDWLPGRDKLIPVQWIESIDWIRRRMFLKITQARARACQRASVGSHLLDRT